MIRKLHFRIPLTVIITLLAILLSSGIAKTVTPEQKDKKEILIIGEKRRTYYQLHRDELVYNIKGPLRLRVIARRAVPRRDNKLQLFGYSMILDKEDELTVKHEQKRSKGVTSPQHPGHGYTQSGKYYLNIPSGLHTLVLRPLTKRSSPVLIRLLTDRFEKKVEGRLLIPDDETTLKHLQVEEKKYRYYQLIPGNKIAVSIEEAKEIVVLSRLAFEDGMPSEESYRLRIRKDEKLLGTYFFTSEKSDVSTIVEDKDIVPGKRRTAEVEVDGSASTVTVELLDKGKRVYIRCVGYE
jgi:hypothetical protein